MVLGSQAAFEVTPWEVVTEGVLCACETIIFCAYILLFCRFLSLFNRGQGAFDKIKGKVKSFFIIMLVLLGFRLACHWTFFWIISEVNLVNLFTNSATTALVVMDVI